VVFNEERKEISVFVLNCAQEDDLEVSFDFRSFGSVRPLEHVVLNGPDLAAVNSFEKPEKVKPGMMEISNEESAQIQVVLRRLSWNMIRFIVR
jgi:alpha-N-arabinofuranosidase